MTKARDLANGGFGLVLIKPSTVTNGTDNGKGTVTFSSVSSVSLNNVFSSTYTNYRIELNGTNASTLLNWHAKMRASGSDSTANYNSSEFWVSSAGSSGIGSYINNGGFFQINTNDNSNGGCPTWFDIFRPFEAAVTNVLGQGYDGSAGKSKYFGGLHNVSTSYDGITIACNTGTISGIISVYGYNK